jgi:hypothetical protein
MLAQILPGFREVRGPLASGFLWLLLGYLIFHGDIAHAHGKVREIVDLGEKLGPAALPVVASFVAYLLGSLSEDLVESVVSKDLLFAQSEAVVDQLRRLQLEGLSESFREQQIVRLENEADRLDSESNLRVAILPPLVAILIYLSIDDRPWWSLGLVLAAALGAQAWDRARDHSVASESLYQLRRDAGIPPASAAEAKAAEPPPPGPNVKLELLELARKGRKLLEYDPPPMEEAEAWADEASKFMRDNARDDDVASFLKIDRETREGTIRAQIQELQNMAMSYGPKDRAV